jgi:fructan beta-fructosidase
MIRVLSALVVLPFFLAADQPDIVIADFEGDAYPAEWTTTGTAFGKGPAKGTLPNQMHVDGFLGKGLVNSYLGGDDATGTLTSAEFKIERKYINFLIGGGKHPGKTCIDLIIDSKTVRTATGPNDRPGGTERLDWHTWDMSDLAGKTATLRIVDEQKGGWGHINIDHIVQSDKKKQAEPIRLDFTIEHRYLHLPVKTGAPVRRMAFTVDGKTVREFDIELDVSAKPQFWAFADVSAFKGKKLIVNVTLPADSRIPDFAESDSVPESEKLYREKHRPLFHFTSRFGWLNDPNGLVYQDKEWHLFYQHNPFGVNWGNMHWGHAVSPDLVHWNELGIGLYPHQHGDWAFSGSAVVDKKNTSGWGAGKEPPLVLAYTSTGRGECIAYSTDRGRTWTEYEKNPVLKHAGRDPKLVWYEKGKHWVMAVYDEFQGNQWIAFHTSKDLKTWEFASRIEGFFECPDLFELPVMGDRANRRWVLYAADGKYLLGDFDGKEFKPAFKEKKQLWHGNFYAAQTFDNAPSVPADKFEPPLPRRVQIGWANGVTFPGMPFNQQMTVPVNLFLHQPARSNDLRMCADPVPELAKLREAKAAFELPPDADGRSIEKPFTVAEDLDAFEAQFRIEPQKSTGFTIDLRGTKLVYDAAKKTLSCRNVSVPCPVDQFVKLHILVDRGSVEVFINLGETALSVAAIPDEKNRRVELIPQGAVRLLGDSWVYRMKSAWRE